MSKKMRENFKQIILTLFAFFLIGIGYINFTKQNHVNGNIAKYDEEKLGDVELVNSNNTDQDQEEEEIVVDNIEVNDEITEYFGNIRLEREKNYSQMIETYEKIINNNSITSEQKSIAINEISKIANQKNSIMIAENLIKNKGFKDVVILANKESTSVVVRTEELLPEKIAQIQNIVSRELGTEITKINISNKY